MWGLSCLPRTPTQIPHLVDRAYRIALARAAGIPLKIAAKVDRADEGYFRDKIAPLLNGEGVTFIGEVNEHQKAPS